jgi:hypothetical protein
MREELENGLARAGERSVEAVAPNEHTK